MDKIKNVTEYLARKQGETDWKTYKSISKLHQEIGISRKRLSELFETDEKHEEYEFNTIVTTIPMTSNDIWKQNNKDRTSKYNAYCYETQNTCKTTFVILAKKVSDTNWMEFETQIKAAKTLNVFSSNIGKVIQGKLKSTGGYIFKKEEREIAPPDEPLETWEKICEDNNYGNACVGAPSPHRILHTTENGVDGKKCCSCKEWKMLSRYNVQTNRWDKLRVDCKDCLGKYRAKPKRKADMTAYNKEYWIKTKEEQTARHKIWRNTNREHFNEYNRIYMKHWEKNQRETNPTFVLLKNLRNRLWQALKSQSVDKSKRTMELCGCTIEELHDYLEKKFTPEMTWENYGSYWHVDHIIPCASWDFTNMDEQMMCFHYLNLQPMNASENCSKGAKYEEDDKEAYIKTFTNEG
jgi:hypothetical protein